jgi:hypothetical protein
LAGAGGNTSAERWRLTSGEDLGELPRPALAFALVLALPFGGAGQGRLAPEVMDAAAEAHEDADRLEERTGSTGGGLLLARGGGGQERTAPLFFASAPSLFLFAVPGRLVVRGVGSRRRVAMVREHTGGEHQPREEESGRAQLEQFRAHTTKLTQVTKERG